MEINPDYDDERLATCRSVSDSTVRRDERDDGETIRKVQAAQYAIPPLAFSTFSPHLPGRVTTSPPCRNKNLETIRLFNDVYDADPSCIDEAEDPDAGDFVLELLEDLKLPSPPDDNSVDANYMFQIRALVAKLLQQLSRISQKDRDQISELKKEYKRLTQETADLQRKSGTNGLIFSLAALGCALFQTANSELDRAVAKIFSENVCPKVGDMFGAEYQAGAQEKSSLANLLLQEYQAKTTKGQSDASNKQEIIQMLQRALDGVTSAARAS